jgi:hypothetical protein
MMMDWNGYREALLGRVGGLAGIVPDIAHGVPTPGPGILMPGSMS